jgi:hypothetical protein
MQSITRLSKENNHQNNKLMMCISLLSSISPRKSTNLICFKVIAIRQPQKDSAQQSLGFG